MSNPIIKIHDVETGEIIEREMNAAELKQFQEDQAAEGIRKVQEATAAAAKSAAEAKLAALGLTADDLKALGL